MRNKWFCIESCINHILLTLYVSILQVTSDLPHIRIPNIIKSLISYILFLFLKNYDTIIRNSHQDPRRNTAWRKNGFETLELYPEE